MPSTTLEFFAATAPGLETITVGELKRLGVKGKAELGGVSYRGDLDTMYATNLWLRTAGRIVVRIARFHASTFHELERRTKHVPWGDFISAGRAARVRVTCRKSRLYHSDAVAQRIMTSIGAAVPDVQLAGEPHGAQLFIVRIADDECEVSADTSGALLHRRGYRQEVAKAPLRETLAAAMLLASGWKFSEPLVDPLCGSGTILIEAALLARGIAPGIKRRFAFMDWPAFDVDRWQKILHPAEQAAVGSPRVLELHGADRDRGAIDAARNNAERAGVAEDIAFEVRPLTATLDDLPATDAGGWILTNPPYGVRLDDSERLRDLYARLGSGLESASGWRLGILTSDVGLAHQTGVTLRPRFSTRNGGIPVAFLAQEKSSVPRSRAASSRAG